MTSPPRQLKERIDEALALIEKWSGADRKVMVLAKRSADGACSAGIMAKLLMYYRCPFEAKVVGLEELTGFLKRRPTVILDFPLPSGTKVEGDWICVSHLPPFKDESDVISIHPELAGLNGLSEACTSSLLYLLAYEAGVTEDEGSVMLLCAGVQGDEQVGSPPSPLKGINDMLISPLIERGLVKISRSLSLFSSKAPLRSVIAVNLDPPLKRVLGSEDDVKKVLRRAGLVDLADKPLSTLSEEFRSRLIQCLLMEALTSGLGAAEAERLVRASLKVRIEEAMEDVAEASRTVDVCAKLGRLALSIQSFLRGRPSLFDQERLEISLSYMTRLARRVRDLITQLEAQPTTCLFELEPEFRGFTLDVARCMAVLHPLVRVCIYSRVNNFLKISIAWREAIEEDVLNRLTSIAEEHKGLFEIGPKWIDIAMPVETLEQIKATLVR
ncbi:MAG: hypothetical protein QXT74_05140 [Candidatus Nezhaarchaeales archaeon]